MIMKYELEWVLHHIYRTRRSFMDTMAFKKSDDEWEVKQPIASHHFKPKLHVVMLKDLNGLMGLFIITGP